MKTVLTSLTLAATLLAGTATLAAETPTTLSGRWDATITRNGVTVPFRLDIKADAGKLQGVLFDGSRPYEYSTSASFADGKLLIDLEHYLTQINAKVEGDALVGNVSSTGRAASSDYAFKAVRHTPTTVSTAAPDISGTWEIPLPTPSSKGEKAFRLVVQQKGAEVEAAILRIDGDTGAYSGVFKDGKWELGHFDGSRPGLIAVSPNADGTLTVQQFSERPPSASAATNGEYSTEAVSDGRYAKTLVAYRPAVARTKGLPEPENFLTHTVAANPDEPFRFAFPDNSGKIISNDDPRFKGKVVVAVVTGTWCPNCHDEAQFLVKLDEKYRDKGLAIVALNFEEPEQQETLKRQKAFVKQYGVKYTYLQAGAPAQMWEKVPQLAHLDTWPATVFVGRDGKVKAVHSGFASAASGPFHAEVQREFESRVEALLAQPAPAAVAAAGGQN